MIKSHFIYCYLPTQKGNNIQYQNYYDLMYSIRSLYKFYKDPFDITIIGKLPDYINENELPNGVQFIYYKDDLNSSTQINITNKQLIMANLFEEFIDINDDIIFIKDVYRKDLEFHYNIGKIRTFKKGENVTGFGKILKNLVDILGPDIINYSSHTPKLFNSLKFKNMIKKYDTSQGISTDVLYQNIYDDFKDKKASDIRLGFWEKPCGKFKLLLEKEKYKFKMINYNETGFILNPWIKEYLENNLKDKCEVC